MCPYRSLPSRPPQSPGEGSCPGPTSPGEAVRLRGTFDVVSSVITSYVNPIWGLGLVVGILEILLGFWVSRQAVKTSAAASAVRGIVRAAPRFLRDRAGLWTAGVSWWFALPKGGNVEQAADQPTIPHPALLEHAEERAQFIQNRIADRITAYAGSMHFVYLHIGLFAVWMILIEESPWPTLTLIVSLEAIFLSTFVLISQNRADEKRQAMAAQEWQSVQLEEQQNEQLLDLSKQILELTDAIHRLTVAHTGLEPGPGTQRTPLPT